MDKTGVTPPDDPKYLGFLYTIQQGFESAYVTLGNLETAARESLQKNSSDPSVLAQYQAVMSEVNIFRNVESSTVKTFKDTDATIVANFR